MPRLSEIVSHLDDLSHAERVELGTKLDWFDSVVAATSGQINAAIGAINFPTEIPTGGKFIGIFTTSCPSGWTRVTALDSKFIRGASSYGGTGGDNTHSHSGMPSHDHGDTDAVGNHAHSEEGVRQVAAVYASGSQAGYYDDAQSTGDGGAHAHVIPNEGSGISTSNNIPAYTNVVFCSKD